LGEKINRLAIIMKDTSKKENIFNIPNALTFSRLIITFIAVFFIFADFPIVFAVVAFVAGMITDCLDGQIARRFNLKTEFGRQFDMVADRFLMIGVAFASIVKLSATGLLTNSQLLQVFLILSREIIASPIVFVAIVFGKGVSVPKVRFIGKLTTVMQAIAFPLVILSIFYEAFSFSLYFAIATGVIGAVSAFYYTQDSKVLMQND